MYGESPWWLRARTCSRAPSSDPLQTRDEAQPTRVGGRIGGTSRAPVRALTSPARSDPRQIPSKATYGPRGAARAAPNPQFFETSDLVLQVGTFALDQRQAAGESRELPGLAGLRALEQLR